MAAFSSVGISSFRRFCSLLSRGVRDRIDPK